MRGWIGHEQVAGGDRRDERAGRTTARFAALAASGADVHGEAAYVGRLAGPRGPTSWMPAAARGGWRIELARRGHRGHWAWTATRRCSRWHDAPRRCSWELVDLARRWTSRSASTWLSRPATSWCSWPQERSRRSSQRLAAHLAPWRSAGQRLADGPADGADVRALGRWPRGWTPVARHATWQGAPWVRAASDWCVAVDRLAAGRPLSGSRPSSDGGADLLELPDLLRGERVEQRAAGPQRRGPAPPARGTAKPSSVRVARVLRRSLVRSGGGDPAACPRACRRRG